MADKGPDDEVGRGILWRATAVIYRYLVLEVLLVVMCLPTLIVMVLLERDASNAPLFVAALLPVAPAFSAGLNAIRGWEAETDLSPSRPFWHAYRRDAVDVLKWWVPVLVILALLVFNLTHLDVVAAGQVVRPVLLLLVAVLTVWAGHLLIITSALSFRVIDAARIAASTAVTHWRVTLAILAELVVAAAVVYTTSEAVLLLFAWAFPALLHPWCAPLISDVTKRFTDA